MRRLGNQVTITTQCGGQVINSDKEDIRFGIAPTDGGDTNAKDGGNKSHGEETSSRLGNAAARKSIAAGKTA